MPRYRISVTLNYDIESEFTQEQLIKIEQEELQRCLSHKSVKFQVRAEKLRERRRNTRLGVFSIEDVLPYICREEAKRNYTVGDKTYAVRMNSQRYFIFRESLSCAACGLTGSKMLLEQNPDDKSPHFNLYAEENGYLVLMTKDHVTPKAYGGEDRHSNYQTMCSICNNLKGHDNLTLSAIAELRKIYNENVHLPKRKLRVLLKEARQRLVEPRTEPTLDKHHQKRLQAVSKASTPRLLLNTDIHVWQTETGLVGRSVYERELENAKVCASIKAGTIVESLHFDDTKVAVRFNENESILIYQGYLDFIS